MYQNDEKKRLQLDRKEKVEREIGVTGIVSEKREKIKKGDDRCSDQTTPPRFMDAKRYRQRMTVEDGSHPVGASARSFRSV